MAYTMAPYRRDDPLYVYTSIDNVRQHYRVGRMIYGMADAGQAWYYEYRDLILSLGYNMSDDDNCLFTIGNDKNGCNLFVTTDDTAITISDNDAGYNYVKELRDAMHAKNWNDTYDPILQHTLGMP